MYVLRQSVLNAVRCHGYDARPILVCCVRIGGLMQILMGVIMIIVLPLIFPF